jgi:hypothetical protein
MPRRFAASSTDRFGVGGGVFGTVVSSPRLRDRNSDTTPEPNAASIVTAAARSQVVYTRKYLL